MLIMVRYRLRAELQTDKKDKGFAKRKTVLKKVVSCAFGMARWEQAQKLTERLPFQVASMTMGQVRQCWSSE